MNDQPVRGRSGRVRLDSAWEWRRLARASKHLIRVGHITQIARRESSKSIEANVEEVVGSLGIDRHVDSDGGV